MLNSLVFEYINTIFVHHWLIMKKYIGKAFLVFIVAQNKNAKDCFN